MGTHEMIVSSSPLEMDQELWGLLGRGPGAACERCHPMGAVKFTRSIKAVFNRPERPSSGIFGEKSLIVSSLRPSKLCLRRS